MKIIVKRVNGKLTINGKQYHETVGEEKIFFEKYINMMKQDEKTVSQKIKEVQDRAAERVVKSIQNYQFKQPLFR